MIRQIAAAVIALLATSASGETITVCADGCDYATIQEAVDVAGSGDVISVASGTYLGNLSVNGKSLAIQWDGVGERPVLESLWQPSIILIDCPGESVTISGFELDLRYVDTGNSIAHIAQGEFILRDCSGLIYPLEYPSHPAVFARLGATATLTIDTCQLVGRNLLGEGGGFFITNSSILVDGIITGELSSPDFVRIIQSEISFYGGVQDISFLHASDSVLFNLWCNWHNIARLDRCHVDGCSVSNLEAFNSVFQGRIFLTNPRLVQGATFAGDYAGTGAYGDVSFDFCDEWSDGLDQECLVVDCDFTGLGRDGNWRAAVEIGPNPLVDCSTSYSTRFWNCRFLSCRGPSAVSVVDGVTANFEDCTFCSNPADEDIAGSWIDLGGNQFVEVCDSDGDGVPDWNDGCPGDPAKIEAGICGCGVPETDSDDDGTPDCVDQCPGDPAKTTPGICGCGVSDVDSDLDGTADCEDGCPLDPGKTAPGACGCGVPDADADSDGVPDCQDACPLDPFKVEPGQCGCGVPDEDSNDDGIADCVDLLTVTFPSGRPLLLGVDQETEIPILIASVNSAPLPSTATLHYQIDDHPDEMATLEYMGADLYTIRFPPVACESAVRWWISVESAAGGLFTEPTAAPDIRLHSVGGKAFETSVLWDFESSDTGWETTNDSGLTSGAWERADPTGTASRGEADPAFSGQFCFVTQNGNGNFDIDGGCTTLTSPAFDARSRGSLVRYARWFDNTGAGTGSSPGSDTMIVQLSPDDGTAWITVETVGPDTEHTGGWIEHAFLISEFSKNTDACRLRFIACDLNAGSVVEAGLDDVRIEVVACSGCVGDLNGDGQVRSADLGLLLVSWGACADCPADLIPDGEVNGADLGMLFQAWGGCP